MKMNTRSRSNPWRSNRGFTLTEILIVLVILGLLAATYINRNYSTVRAPAVAITRDSLQAQVEATYGNWLNAGGTHVATATTLSAQTNMAYDLLTVLTAVPGVNAANPPNFATTAVADSVTTGPQPLSNTIRMQLRNTFATGGTGVTYGQYYILFKPTTTSSGQWQITTTPGTVIP